MIHNKDMYLLKAEMCDEIIKDYWNQFELDNPVTEEMENDPEKMKQWNKRKYELYPQLWSSSGALKGSNHGITQQTIDIIQSQ